MFHLGFLIKLWIWIRGLLTNLLNQNFQRKSLEMQKWINLSDKSYVGEMEKYCKICDYINKKVIKSRKKEKLTCLLKLYSLLAWKNGENGSNRQWRKIGETVLYSSFPSVSLPRLWFNFQKHYEVPEHMTYLIQSAKILFLKLSNLIALLGESSH